jgi:hypothetical protein
MVPFLLIRCQGISVGGQLTQGFYEALPHGRGDTTPTSLVSSLARGSRDTPAARVAGGPIALRLGQFNEARLALHLGQPVGPGRAAWAPPSPRVPQAGGSRPHPCVGPASCVATPAGGPRAAPRGAASDGPDDAAGAVGGRGARAEGLTACAGRRSPAG